MRRNGRCSRCTCCSSPWSRSAAAACSARRAYWMSETAAPLEGKVALVAGGYGGIGEACARALVEQGATTVIAGRDAGKAAALASALGGASASFVLFDAQDVASIRAAVGEAASRHGRIDFLVNCLGTQQIEPLVDVTEEAFDRVLDVNLKAAMFLGQ